MFTEGWPETESLNFIKFILHPEIEKLLMKKEITREMATCLMIDSVNAIRLTQMLIDVAIILYVPENEQVNTIEENIPASKAVNLEELLTESDLGKHEPQDPEKVP